ncbi:AraC family transcriptional regulator [Caulobacter sp. 602-1]|uniref:helix-turn-helix domain-containing protein n=1 Tax=Caulobacter sp. 602-1 TaxID=2492472 RepID=UPI000F63B09D|nr:AraC family transcriptional regulator [Caulobacter sp. 602-1]RRN63863.1 AraC family transcriptional regulator [Caulobacter sp. 602-1]
MDNLECISAEAACNTRAVASLVRHAITKLDADPNSARQYLLNAETLLAPSTPPAAPTVQPSGLAPWQAKRVSAYIDSNLGGAICLSDLARMARLSRGHFGRGFKRTFGERFHLFLTRKRVERAQALMTGTRLRLCDVACATGFADQSHFTRAFREITGATPGQWRREALDLTMDRLTPAYRA